MSSDLHNFAFLFLRCNAIHKEEISISKLGLVGLSADLVSSISKSVEGEHALE